MEELIMRLGMFTFAVILFFLIVGIFWFIARFIYINFVLFDDIEDISSIKSDCRINEFNIIELKRKQETDRKLIIRQADEIAELRKVLKKYEKSKRIKKKTYKRK